MSIMKTSIPYLTLLLSLCVSAQDFDYVTECPEENGVFADALQCDRYYECRDNEVTEHLCPDGLVFDETSFAFAKCSFPFSIPCDGRDELQPAQPSPGCPRKNGYFADADPTVCDVFNFCSDGVPHRQQCPGGLIFDPALGQCGWSDQTTRKGCTSKDLINFKCPDQSPNSVEHTRHADPEDCNIFYLCIGGQPRKSRCSQGLVFKESTLSCERQEDVEGFCSTWFNQTYLDTIFAEKPTTRRPILRDSPNRRARPRPQVSDRDEPVFDLRRPSVTRPTTTLPPQLAALAENSQLGFVGQDRQRLRPTARPQQQFAPQQDFRQEVEDPRDRFTRPPQSRRPFATEAPARRQPATFEASREPEAPVRQQTQFNARRPTSNARQPVRQSANDFLSQFESQFDAFDPQISNARPESQFSAFSDDAVSARRPEPETNLRTSIREPVRNTDFGSRGNVPRAPFRQRPSSPVEAVEPEVEDEPASPEGGFGLRRRVPISRTKLATSVRRGVASRRRPPAADTSDAAEQQQPSRTRGRLEVTNIDLPPLRPVDDFEDEAEVPLAPVRSRLPQQRFRGRQN